MIPVPKAFWELYAAVKYWSREVHGPREKTGTITLEELAVGVCNILEVTWREGHREEHLTRAVRAEIRRRKGEKRDPGCSGGVEPVPDSGVVHGLCDGGRGGDSGPDCGTEARESGTTRGYLCEVWRVDRQGG